jgi:hypothetical protein
MQPCTAEHGQVRYGREWYGMVRYRKVQYVVCIIVHYRILSYIIVYYRMVGYVKMGQDGKGEWVLGGSVCSRRTLSSFRGVRQ